MALTCKPHENTNAVLLASKSRILSLTREIGSHKILDIPVRPKPENIKKPDGDKKDEQGQGDASHLPSTTCIAASPCGAYVAAATVEKLLIVWDESGKVKFQQDIPRKASAVTFTPNGKDILVADKSGDVYQFSLDAPAAGRLILGHLSVLLDMLVTPDGQFVITSDRDEKIRVSHYPNAYNIQGFCLGHTEFVTSVALVQDSDLKNKTWLVSASGDGTIALWDYENCIQHCLIKCSEDIKESDSSHSAIPIRAVKSHGNVVAAVPDRSNEILVYQVKNKILVPLSTIKTQGSPLELTFDTQGILWTVEDDETVLHAYDSKSGSQIPFTLPEDALSVAKDCAASCPKDLSPLHKRWFDNMEAYNVRKEERMAKKKKKCN